MTKEVRFTVEVPDVECTNEQLEEWLSFELGASCSMSQSNPLNEYGDPEIVFGSFEMD